jgi:hypothetical protein
MRFVWVIALLLLGSLQSWAEETPAEFKRRLQQHVDGVRYAHVIRQAANRADQKGIIIQFRIGSDGSLQNVSVSSGSISKELRAHIGRAFEQLPKLKSVPGWAVHGMYRVPLILGG